MITLYTENPRIVFNSNNADWKIRVSGAKFKYNNAVVTDLNFPDRIELVLQPNIDFPFVPSGAHQINIVTEDHCLILTGLYTFVSVGLSTMGNTIVYLDHFTGDQEE